jgi:hypothetical protein
MKFTHFLSATAATRVLGIVVLGSLLSSYGASAQPAPTPAPTPPLKWVTGKVVSIIAQLPQFTVATVGTTGVRFCYPISGADFPITADNVHYDMLRSALLAGKTVEVGVHNFGLDPQAGAEKNCIDRIILRE